MDRIHIKNKILSLIRDNWDTISPTKEYRRGEDFIQYAGSTINADEITAAVDILLDGWFGLSKKANEFENELAHYIGTNSCVVVNSGSSANLLAISALKSLKLANRLKDGDEIITSACGFPTTINPIIQNNLVPVFVDQELGTYNINISQIEEAMSSKTKAIFIVHTLGNPVDMSRVMEIAKKHNLYVIEDCCDALGSEIFGQKVGSFGDISTISFYPAHHITMGEGGAALTSDPILARVIRSMRDWGRDCYCTGQSSMLKDGLCGKRFDKWLPELDVVVDHKYVYSEIGYNLKPLELQCAIGLEQLKKLPEFIEMRNDNFNRYYQFISQYQDFFILPKWHEDANPSWFAFPITVRKDLPFQRYELTHYLEERKIQTRNLFAGNILYHPAYKEIEYRAISDLENATYITTNTFFLGVYPGIKEDSLDYILATIEEFIKRW